jgi:two-component system sensor histidine kinase MtrB
VQRAGAADHATGGVRQRFGWAGRWIRQLAAARPTLRQRILLTFALGSFALSLFLAGATYGFTKSALLRQRDRTAIRQAQRNAELVDADLAASPTITQIAARLATLDARAAVYYRGEWAASAAQFGRTAIPEPLDDEVVNVGRSARMIVTVQEERVVVVGIPLSATDAGYFEFVSSRQTVPDDPRQNVLPERSCSPESSRRWPRCRCSGWSGRQQARSDRWPTPPRPPRLIAGGRLDTRLEPDRRPRPQRTLAERRSTTWRLALQASRRARRRFASDVSHELRSPLMTLAASAE